MSKSKEHAASVAAKLIRGGCAPAKAKQIGNAAAKKKFKR